MMLPSGRAASPAGGEIDHRGAAPTQERGGGRAEEEGERGRKEGDGGEEKIGGTMHQRFKPEGGKLTPLGLALMGSCG